MPLAVLLPNAKNASPLSMSSVPPELTVVVPETDNFPRVLSVPPSFTVMAPPHTPASPVSIITVSPSATVRASPHPASVGVYVVSANTENTAPAANATSIVDMRICFIVFAPC